MQRKWKNRRVTNRTLRAAGVTSRTLRYTKSMSRLRRLQVTGKTFFSTCNVLPVRTQLPSFTSCCSPPRLTPTQLQSVASYFDLERAFTSPTKYALRRTVRPLDAALSCVAPALSLTNAGRCMGKDGSITSGGKKGCETARSVRHKGQKHKVASSLRVPRSTGCGAGRRSPRRAAPAEVQTSKAWPVVG